MHEICQSGSEGGAKPTLSLPLSSLEKPSRRVRYDRARLIPDVFLVEMCAVFLKEG
jgi:hypothetical protein